MKKVRPAAIDRNPELGGNLDRGIAGDGKARKFRRRVGVSRGCRRSCRGCGSGNGQHAKWPPEAAARRYAAAGRPRYRASAPWRRAGRRASLISMSARGRARREDRPAGSAPRAGTRAPASGSARRRAGVHDRHGTKAARAPVPGLPDVDTRAGQASWRCPNAVISPRPG